MMSVISNCICLHSYRMDERARVAVTSVVSFWNLARMDAASSCDVRADCPYLTGRTFQDRRAL